MTDQGTNGATPETSAIDSDILATMHRMAHQVDEMYKQWQVFRPLVEAYQRGGMLAARTAAKRGRTNAT